jgi:hypothetical protein
MENNLDKQLVPYMEHVIGQTLDMVEKLFVDTDNIDKKEIKNLLTHLKEDFGDYITLLSPKIQGRLFEINDKILKDDTVHES